MADTYSTANMLPKKMTVEDCKGSRDVDIITQQYSMAMDFVTAMSVLADEERDVEIIINSPGGEVSAGLVIYDIIQSYKNRITMYCTGLAASMGAVIFAGGQKGRRFILPHSKVMIHEPLIAGGMGGSATTIEKTAQKILETKSVLSKILSHHTGKTVEQINEATVFDNYMSADEAIKFGICDDIRSIF